MNKLILIGNPNVGKSVVFGHLTGNYVTVSNYPGTTVEISRGTGQFEKEKIEIIDLPGTNSLIPSSEDEKVARDFLLAESDAHVIQVADAKNLRRTLHLTIEMAELGRSMLLDLNMIDELKQRRFQINTSALARLLGIPVLTSAAVDGFGINELKKQSLRGRVSPLRIDYGQQIEGALTQLLAVIPQLSRGMALMFLAGDSGIVKIMKSEYGSAVLAKMTAIQFDLQNKFPREIHQIIFQIRNREVNRLVEQVLVQEPVKVRWLETLGGITMRPITGVPILMFVLYLMYKLVGEFAAGTGVDFMESHIFGQYLNPWATQLVSFIFPWTIVREFLVGDYGLVTMALTYALAIVFPIITAFFLFFSVLEDSGYLPRLAILLNKSFRLIGLSGKAIIPMVLGLGCDTMATMTTRTLETKRERIIATLLLALAIPCSAQLGVILGMIGGLSPQATFIWVGTVLFVFLLVGWLAAQVLPGKSSDFILEIPPLRIPKLGNIIVKTLARLEWYLREAVPLFIIGTMILFFLDKFAVLKIIEQLASPLVVTYLGLPAKATEAFLIGFLRRDYGAAGLFALAKQGLLTPNQIVVSLVTITLFVPCIAQFLVMIKERGLKTTLWMTAFIVPFSFLTGGVLNWALNFFEIVL
ncbi:MAG: ferrous iron transport protein B [bacterium]